MNIYDFDKTIYDGDSTVNFYFYCLKRQPAIIFYLIYQGFYFFLFITTIISKTQFKDKFFSFFRGIKNIDKMVEGFWKKNEHKIKKFYKQQQRPDDIIISASPYFLLKHICEKIGIENLIASNVDKYTGKYDGENCYGEEKVIRLYKEFGEVVPDEFYSDSLSDSPLAEISKKSYLVDKNNLIEWETYQPTSVDKIKSAFLTREFMAFILIGGINTINGILFAWIYSSFLNANLAFVAGYITGLIISYFLNNFITFKDTLSFKMFIRFAVSYIPNFIIQNIVVFLVYNLLGINKLIAFALAAFIGIPVTFLLMKFFAFRKE